MNNFSSCLFSSCIRLNYRFFTWKVKLKLIFVWWQNDYSSVWFSIIYMVFFLPEATLSNALSALWWTAWKYKWITILRGALSGVTEWVFFLFVFLLVLGNDSFLYCLLLPPIYNQNSFILYYTNTYVQYNNILSSQMPSFLIQTSYGNHIADRLKGPRTHQPLHGGAWIIWLSTLYIKSVK